MPCTGYFVLACTHSFHRDRVSFKFIYDTIQNAQCRATPNYLIVIGIKVPLREKLLPSKFKNMWNSAWPVPKLVYQL